MEKGSLSRQLLDLKNLQLFEQLQTLCDNFPEFNERSAVAILRLQLRSRQLISHFSGLLSRQYRFDVLGTHIEVTRNSVSEVILKMECCDYVNCVFSVPC